MSRDDLQHAEEGVSPEPFCTSLDYLLEDEEQFQGRLDRPNLLHAVRIIILAIARTIIWLSGIALWVGAIGIHLWTIIIAFIYGGFIGAFLTFMLPVIGQIFWAWRLYAHTGYFWNAYTIVLAAYIAALVLAALGAVIVAICEGE